MTPRMKRNALILVKYPVYQGFFVVFMVNQQRVTMFGVYFGLYKNIGIGVKKACKNLNLIHHSTGGISIGTRFKNGCWNQIWNHCHRVGGNVCLISVTVSSIIGMRYSLLKQ